MCIGGIFSYSVFDSLDSIKSLHKVWLRQTTGAIGSDNCPQQTSTIDHDDTQLFYLISELADEMCLRTLIFTIIALQDIAAFMSK